MGKAVSQSIPTKSEFDIRRLDARKSGYQCQLRFERQTSVRLCCFVDCFVIAKRPANHIRSGDFERSDRLDEGQATFATLPELMCS